MLSFRTAFLSCGIGVIAIFASVSAQETWTLRSQLPTQQNLSGVVWAGTQFVAVGYAGTIVTSPDGITWTSRTSGTSNNLQVIAWTGSRLVACGDSTIVTSTDGITWSAAINPIAKNINAMTWAGTKLVAVGNVGTIFTSPDGSTWTKCDSVTNSTLYSVAYGNNMIIATTSNYGTIVTSTDGITWTIRNIQAGFYLNSISWANNQFIGNGIGSYADTLIVSSNGLNWNKIALKKANASSNVYFYLTAMTWTGSQIIAVAASSLSGSDPFLTSTDATNWTMRYAPLPSGNFKPMINAIASSTAGRTVAVGTSGTILSSTDGVTWVSCPSSIPAALYSIARTDTRWVTSGASNDFYSSPDAIAWSFNPGISFQYQYQWYKKAMVWTGNQLVALSGTTYLNSIGSVLISPDGINWRISLTTNMGLYGIAWTGTQMIGAGYGGTVMTSADGIDWTYHPSGTFNSINSVDWTGKLVICVGDNSTIITSPDGTIWTRRFVNQLNNLLAVHWTGTQLIAVGENGTILTSPDGNSWTAQNSGTTKNLLGIAGDATHMAAVGDSGIIISSKDGINWSKQSSGTIATLYAVACADSQFVAVGGNYNNGVVVTSPISTNTANPLAKSIKPAFEPRIDAQGITVDLKAGYYSLSLFDVAGRALFSSTGNTPSAMRRTIRTTRTSGCAILKLQQEGVSFVKTLSMVR